MSDKEKSKEIMQEAILLLKDIAERKISAPRSRKKAADILKKFVIVEIGTSVKDFHNKDDKKNVVK